MLRRGFLLMVVLSIWTGEARADGGTVRASQRINGYQITVFTDPTPLVAGKVDVSVLVQDARGQSLLDVPVNVRAWPVDSPQSVVSGPATTDAATNKLLRAIPLTFRDPGRWQIEVTADLPEGPAPVMATADVSAALPSWIELAGWIGWPLVPVLLFLLHAIRSRPPVSAGPSGEPAK